MRTSIARALRVCLAVCSVVACGAVAEAGVVRLESSAPSSTPVITFSETTANGQLVSYLKPNPAYSFSNVDQLGDITVQFGSRFVGQSYGAMANSLGDTSPSGPLTIDMAAAPVGVVLEKWAGDKLVLGGMDMTKFKYFTTPIAMAFSKPVGWVSFDTGRFDHGQTTLIEAFGPTGVSLGTWWNTVADVENFYLSETTGNRTIAGISIYVPSHGMDWEGFAIDNVRFGAVRTPDPPDGENVPEPSSALLLAGGLLCLVSRCRARRVS
ncbi:MAG: PEP-CTERM sorting domain-containing protein [Pirellulales bacterium]